MLGLQKPCTGFPGANWWAKRPVGERTVLCVCVFVCGLVPGGKPKMGMGISRNRPLQ